MRSRLPEPRPVLVAAGDVVSHVLRPRNLTVAAVVAAVAVYVGGTLGVLLGVLAAPFLLGAGVRTGWRFTGRGRTRRELGDGGWATRRDLAEHTPKGPATRLGSTTVGPPVPIPLRVPHESSVLILGGPRRGKTLTLADIVRQHDGRGPRYISSTRTDLLRATIRAPKGGEAPVWVFIPEGVGGAMGRLLNLWVQAGWVRPMRWSPLEGCDDPRVAADRAAALVEATDSGSVEDQTWLQSATTVLRCLLRAAALGGGDMRDVYRWVTSPADMQEAGKVLLQHDRMAATELASEVLSANERGAASVLRAARQAVEFMADPNVAAACCPGSDDAVLDVRQLIEQDETLHVVGRERKRQGTQPLMAALTTHLHDTAVRLADEQENDRLPRPLLLAADELKVTARVPWDEWLATAGGSGLHMVGVAQSPAQLREKWGEHGADAIVDNSTSVLVFGGLKGKGDLEAFAYLCGDRWEPLPHDPEQHAERPVMTGDRLSGLRKFRALHLGGGLPRPTVLGTARWVKAAEVVSVLRATTAGAAVVARSQIAGGVARPALPAVSRAALPPASPQVVPARDGAREAA